MPTIITRGAASAKGFGFTGLTRELTTVTFTSNGVWIAPSSVSAVAVLTGKGQDGAAGYWDDLANVSSAFMAYVQFNAPSGLSSSTVEAQAQSSWDLFPTSYNPSGSALSWTEYYYDSTGPTPVAQSGTIRLKNGYSKTKTGNGWGSSWTTPLSFGDNKAYGVGNMEQYVNPTTGASSSALGYTFAGGSGGPATPATYNNIPVTPTASYSIVVPSGGYVTIQYYA